MSRTNLALILIVVSTAAALSAIRWWGPSTAAVERILVYLPMPHPYCNEVGAGARAEAARRGISLRVATGAEPTQAVLNANIESFVAQGYRAIALYPLDPAGSKGLCERLAAQGVTVVAYGAEPEAGTPVVRVVATNTRAAARLAGETMAKLLDGRGGILNVLEGMSDANTPLRRAAIEAVVAEHPAMQLVQTIGDITTEQAAREKIESALAARGDAIDGIICTGYTTTVAAATLLAERHRDPTRKRIRFIGLDTDERVLSAIRDGHIDATIAQNTAGHGRIPVAILDLIDRPGGLPAAGSATAGDTAGFIDTGAVVVTRDNLDRFATEIDQLTDQVIDRLSTRP